MDFGMAQYVPQECGLCGDLIQIADRITVDRETIHKKCFMCCYCGKNLDQGNAAMERAFYNRWGPRFYCRGTAGICSTLPNQEKEAKLKEKGLAQRKTGGKAKK